VVTLRTVGTHPRAWSWRTTDARLAVAPVAREAGVGAISVDPYRLIRVALPAGRVPAVGETVTIKFDPNSRRQFVLLEDSYQVVDHVQQAVGMINRLAGAPKP